MTSENLGNLVPLKCGHRGKPNRSEEKLIENLLHESGFIYSKSKKKESEKVSKVKDPEIHKPQREKSMDIEIK